MVILYYAMLSYAMQEKDVVKQNDVEDQDAKCGWLSPNDA